MTIASRRNGAFSRSRTGDAPPPAFHGASRASSTPSRGGSVSPGRLCGSVQCWTQSVTACAACVPTAWSIRYENVHAPPGVPGPFGVARYSVYVRNGSCTTALLVMRIERRQSIRVGSGDSGCSPASPPGQAPRAWLDATAEPRISAVRRPASSRPDDVAIPRRLVIRWLARLSWGAVRVVGRSPDVHAGRAMHGRIVGDHRHATSAAPAPPSRHESGVCANSDVRAARRTLRLAVPLAAAPSGARAHQRLDRPRDAVDAQVEHREQAADHARRLHVIPLAGRLRVHPHRAVEVGGDAVQPLDARRRRRAARVDVAVRPRPARRGARRRRRPPPPSSARRSAAARRRWRSRPCAACARACRGGHGSCWGSSTPGSRAARARHSVPRGRLPVHLFALGLIIGGGTAQVQKNIIAERGFGKYRGAAPG